MTQTTKYILIGAGSFISTGIISALAYVKGKQTGIAIGMKQAAELPASVQQERVQQQHAQA